MHCGNQPAPHRRLRTFTGSRGFAAFCHVRHVSVRRSSSRTVQGLTPHSSGAPTAGHQARSGGTRYIFASPGLASCRCRPLNSNVRPRMSAMVATPAFSGNAPRAQRGSSVFLACGQHRGFGSGFNTLTREHRIANQANAPSQEATSDHALRQPICTSQTVLHLHRQSRLRSFLPRQARFRPALKQLRGARPNPSFKRSANGRPPGPVWR